VMVSFVTPAEAFADVPGSGSCSRTGRTLPPDDWNPGLKLLFTLEPSIQIGHVTATRTPTSLSADPAGRPFTSSRVASREPLLLVVIGSFTGRSRRSVRRPLRDRQGDAPQFREPNPAEMNCARQDSNLGPPPYQGGALTS
jgi:hypothetical protein